MVGAAATGGVVSCVVPPTTRARSREIERGKGACEKSERKRKKKPVQPSTTTWRRRRWLAGRVTSEEDRNWTAVMTATFRTGPLSHPISPRMGP